MKANQIEIPLVFSNYKLLKDVSFNLKGSYLYFILGSNNVGKTSIKNGIASMLTAKNITDEPVSRGEKQGVNSAKLPAADGLMYDVDWFFTNEKSTFVVTRPDGKKIDKVNEIRDLFKYTNFTVSEWFNWSLTADGIRKQQKVILELLTKEEQDAYQLAKDEETLLFDNRKDKKKELDILVKQIVPLTQEELTTLANEQLAKDRITKLEKELDDLKNTNLTYLSLSIAKEKLLSITQTYDNEFITLETIDAVTKNLFEVKEKLKVIPSNVDEKLAEINTAIETGRTYLNSINTLKQKQLSITEQQNKLTLCQKDLDKFESDLETARNKQKSILQNSSLPFDNIELTDEGVTIDGFSFKETQICRSAAIKAIASIMCKINPSPIILMDDASHLDNDSLMALNELAEQTNHILIFDQVVRTETEIQIVGYDEV